MKTLIIYYSQSGNTQKIANGIAEGIQSAGNEVDLLFMDNRGNINVKENAAEAYGYIYQIMDQYDLIGIGSPIWYEMPPNVRCFVESMPQRNGQMCFSFCTHGTMPNLYFPLVIPRLQRKGFRVIGWENWYANCSIQIFPEPYYTAGHPDEQDMNKAVAFGKQLCETAEKVLAGDDSILPEAPAPNMMHMHANAAIEHLGGFHNVHGRLIRDPEKCLYPKCHICMDNCTMGYIQLDQEPQKYGNNGTNCDDCHGCTYCEMLCPVGAIHPAVPYEEAAPVGQEHGSELFEMVLSKAEEEGKFRRLLPFEEVGTKTPFYSVHDKHPRKKQLKK